MADGIEIPCRLEVAIDRLRDGASLAENYCPRGNDLMDYITRRPQSRPKAFAIGALICLPRPKAIVAAISCLICLCFAFATPSLAQSTQGWIQVHSYYFDGNTDVTPCVAFSQFPTADATTLQNDVIPLANQCINQVNTLVQTQCTKVGSTSGDIPSFTSADTGAYLLGLGPLAPGVTEGFGYHQMLYGGCQLSPATVEVSWGTYQCPAGGSIPVISDGYPQTPGYYPYAYCGAVFYVEAAQPPLAQMGSPDPAGEPVNPSTGSVYLTATDVQAVGAETVGFQRYYNSADATGTEGVPGWRHSYGRSIATIYQGVQKSNVHSSPTYLTASAACTSGFTAIQSSSSAWGAAIASYSNGVCVLSVGGVTIGTLPVYSLVSLPPPPTPTVIEYDVIRDNGQTIRFTVQQGAISSSPGISIRLAVTGSGFTVTDDQDNVESYNSAGVLQSITSRTGVAQTLSYTNGYWSGVTDSFGNSLSASRNAVGAIVSITVHGGGTVQYSYDAQQRLSAVTNLDGSTRSYVYGSYYINALTAEVDESGTTLSTWNYDDINQERAISAQQAGGANATSLSYNSDGSVTVTDGSAGRTFIYTRVGDINQVSTINGPLCRTCQDSAATTYDSYGWVASRTDYNGNLTCYSNDAVRGLELVRVEGFAPGSSCPTSLSSYTPTAGTPQRKITIQWSPTWREPSLITEPNRTTAFTFDGSGNVLSKIITDLTVSPNISRTWIYTYNGYGQVLTVKGPRTDVNSTNTYTYYSCSSGMQCGQLNTVQNAVGQLTTFSTYNAYGQPLTITDPNGVVTTLAYDTRQRRTSRQVGTELTSYSYYPTGVLKTVTLPDGSTLTYTYDGAHRLTKIADGVGNYLSYTLDALGNRTSESAYDAGGVLSRTHSRVFNSVSEIAQDIGANPVSAIYYGYDNNGNRTGIYGPISRDTYNQYDARNRLTQVTNPAGGLTILGYDADDNVASVIDPNSLQTTYTHNGFGNLSQQVSPATGTTTNTYDSVGNLSTRTDARGAVAAYTYDALNRMTSAAFHVGGVTDPTISFTYDASTNGVGRLTGASDANHALAWSYDTLGRVTGARQAVGGVSLNVGYSYMNGDLSTMTTPSGQTITYSYTDHQISGIAVNSTTLLASVAYDAFGPARGWAWGNSTGETRLHNTDGNPSQITGPDSISLSYDDAYRITGITSSTNNALSWTLGYDSMDRTTSAAQPGTSLGYSYDADGNRLTQTGASVPSPLWTAGASFTYNARGRMNSASQGGSTMAYTYNALGQMIEKSGATTTMLVYDTGGHLLGEYTAGGSLIQETVWLNDLPVATLRPNGTGGIIVYYVHANQLGAPRLVTRPSDNVIMWRWDTEPFGTSAPNQNPQAQGTFVYNLRFPGQYYQAETGLNYNYLRDYDPNSGRYVQSDPIGLGGGVNTYAYAGGNPVTLTDPNGLFASPWHFAITYDAARNAGYSVGGSIAIAWYSVTTDIGTQGIADANIHSMAIGGPNPQSVADAQAGSQAYVDSQLAQGTLQGLGNAAHTEEDAFASGHEFQPWNGGFPSLAHEIGDWFPSYQSVTDAYSAAFSTLYQERNPSPAPQSCPAQ